METWSDGVWCTQGVFLGGILGAAVPIWVWGVQMGLGRSLYAHLQDAGVVPMLLDTQYR